MKSLLLGICMIIVLALPPMRELLESVMIVHMLVQLPLLIIFGWIIGKYLLQRFPGFFAKWNGTGITGIIIVMFVTTYWMIPRAVDDALLYVLNEIESLKLNNALDIQEFNTVIHNATQKFLEDMNLK